MEFIIHGTKGGYRVLFKTNNMPPSVAKDSRRIDGSRGTPRGSSAYSLSFTESGCAYSKYVILWDSRRNAMGNISFTVYIPSNNRISGHKVKSLLDEIGDQYLRTYVENNELGSTNENWDFVTDIAIKYKNDISEASTEDIEYPKMGNETAAFIYYRSDIELQKYLDVPYQKEYYPFEQVFFVESGLFSLPQNPLNALSYDLDKDFTGKIDLDNPSYSLKGFQSKFGGTKIEIWANNKPRSNESPKDLIIHKKDNIRIRLTKDYYDSIDFEGDLYDEKIARYLNVDESNNKVSLQTNNIFLSPQKATIRVIANDSYKRELPNVRLWCELALGKGKREIIDNEITFEGEELGKQWIIYGKHDSSEGEVQISPLEKPAVTLVLQELKKVWVIAKDKSTNKMIQNLSIIISNKSENINNPIVFTNDEIRKKWRITVWDKDGKYNPDTQEYLPSNDDAGRIEATLELKKAIPSAENLTPNNNSKTPINTPLSPSNNTESPKSNNRNRSEIWGVLPYVMSVVAIVGVLGSGAYFLLGEKNSISDEEPNNTKANTAISWNYLEENELFVSQLEKMEKNCHYQDTLKGNTTSCDEGNRERLKNALTYRKHINHGELEDICRSTYSSSIYPLAHERLKGQACRAANSSFKEEIKSMLRNPSVETMNLDTVAAFIANVEKLFEIREEVETANDKYTINAKKVEVSKIESDYVKSLKDDIVKAIEDKLLTINNAQSAPKAPTPNSENKKGGNGEGNIEKGAGEKRGKAPESNSISENGNYLTVELLNSVKSAKKTEQTYKDLLKSMNAIPNPSKKLIDAKSCLEKIIRCFDEFSSIQDRSLNKVNNISDICQKLNCQ